MDVPSSQMRKLRLRGLQASCESGPPGHSAEKPDFEKDWQKARGEALVDLRKWAGFGQCWGDIPGQEKP